MKKRTAAVAAILACAMMFTGCSDSILTSSGDTTTSTEKIWTANDDDVVAWSTVDSLSAEDKEYYQVKF